MGSLALRPGNSLTILLDGFVNRLQDSQFPFFLLFKLRGFDFYPGGTFTHCSCQPSLDAHFAVPILNTLLRFSVLWSSNVRIHGPGHGRCLQNSLLRSLVHSRHRRLEAEASKQ